MIIYANEETKAGLSGLMEILDGILPGVRLYGSTDLSEILELSSKIAPDVIFLPAKRVFPEQRETVQQLMEAHPNLNIIFTAENNDLALEAIRLRASGYLLKPLSGENVLSELSHLRNPVPEIPAEEEKKLLHVRTFGNFEVFDRNGTPVRFLYKKTKEMLAYLIDRRGAMCTIHEIMAVLWETSRRNEHASYFRNLRIDLLQSLEKIGAREIVVRERGTMGIRRERIDCDLFDYLDGKGRKGKDGYFGEYMSQYSWSEATNSNLFFRFRSGA